MAAHQRKQDMRDDPRGSRAIDLGSIDKFARNHPQPAQRHEHGQRRMVKAEHEHDPARAKHRVVGSRRGGQPQRPEQGRSRPGQGFEGQRNHLGRDQHRQHEQEGKSRLAAHVGHRQQQRGSGSDAKREHGGKHADFERVQRGANDRGAEEFARKSACASGKKRLCEQPEHRPRRKRADKHDHGNTKAACLTIEERRCCGPAGRAHCSKISAKSLRT